MSHALRHGLQVCAWQVDWLDCCRRRRCCCTGDGPSPLPHIPAPCSLRHALTACVDLTSVPRKSLLRLLGEHAADDAERRTLLFLSSRGGRQAYADDISSAQPSLLDLLRRFPSARPPLAALLDGLQPLAPRMYSLTAAPVAGGSVPGAAGRGTLQFALSVVRYETAHGTRRGVASTWLERLAAPWLGGGDAGAAAASAASHSCCRGAPACRSCCQHAAAVADAQASVRFLLHARLSLAPPLLLPRQQRRRGPRGCRCSCGAPATSGRRAAWACRW